MLFKKHAKSSSSNILYDLSSFLVSFLILGPLATLPNTSLYLDRGSFFETFIEEQISDFLPDYSVEVDQVEILPFFSLSQVETKIHKIRISGPSGQFTFPESVITFNINSLFSRGMPNSVKLNEVKILVDSEVLSPQYANVEHIEQNKIFSQLLSAFLKQKRVKQVEKLQERPKKGLQRSIRHVCRRWG